MSTSGPSIGAGADDAAAVIAGALAATTRVMARRINPVIRPAKPTTRRATALKSIMTSTVTPVTSMVTSAAMSPAVAAVATSVAEAVESPVWAAGRSRGRKADGFADRRRRYLAVMRVLGFEREFAELPAYLQEFLYKRKAPDPSITFDASVPTEKHWRAVRRAAERGFREAAFEVVEGSGRRVNWRDYHAIVPALAEAVTVEPTIPARKRNASFTRFCDAIRERLLAILDDVLKRSARAMYEALCGPLLMNSRCDRRLLVARCAWTNGAGGKSECRFVVSAERAEVRDVCLDGKPRRMFRVTEAGAWIKPVSWKGSDLRRKGRAADADYPVYVQSHALVQLYDRLDDPASRPWLDCWLAESLSRPVITGQTGGDLFVEFRLDSRRVGYLVVTPLHEEKLVAVRTFLFLTMEKTPEAQRLASRLKLRRDDLDWLRLQTLSGFTRTDLGNDLALRQKLDECGCGHLFDLRDANYTPVEGSAAEMRRYVRLAA